MELPVGVRRRRRPWGVGIASRHRPGPGQGLHAHRLVRHRLHLRPRHRRQGSDSHRLHRQRHRMGHHRGEDRRRSSPPDEVGGSGSRDRDPPSIIFRYFVGTIDALRVGGRYAAVHRHRQRLRADLHGRSGTAAGHPRDRRSGLPATSPTAGPTGHRDTAKSKVHARGGEAAMTDDDSGLSQTEAAQWDAIVASEWPIESAILTTQLSSASVPIGGADGTAEQRSRHGLPATATTTHTIGCRCPGTRSKCVADHPSPDSRLSGRRPGGHLPVRAGRRGARRSPSRPSLMAIACRCGEQLHRRLDRRYCPIPTSTLVVPPRCQPIDSGDRVRPPTQPRDARQVDPAAPLRVAAGAGGFRCSWNARAEQSTLLKPSTSLRWVDRPGSRSSCCARSGSPPGPRARHGIACAAMRQLWIELAAAWPESMTQGTTPRYGGNRDERSSSPQLCTSWPPEISCAAQSILVGKHPTQRPPQGAPAPHSAASRLASLIQVADGHVESFNSRIRDECLPINIFLDPCPRPCRDQRQEGGLHPPPTARHSRHRAQRSTLAPAPTNDRLPPSVDQFLGTGQPESPLHPRTSTRNPSPGSIVEPKSVHDDGIQRFFGCGPSSPNASPLWLR